MTPVAQLTLRFPNPLVFAAAIAMAALLPTWLLWPVMEHNPFLFFLGGAALSAWYGGWRAGLLTTVMGALLAYGLLSLSTGHWLPSTADLSRLSLFVVLAGMLAWFSEHRRRAEQARRRSDERFARLFASASEGILIVDERGCITSANERAERMFGYERGELIGQSVEVLVPAPLRERHVKHRMTYAASPQVRSMSKEKNLRACRKDGTEFPVEISLSYVRDEQGLVVMAFVVDTTERKEAEATIRRHQERVQRMAFELAMAGQREARRIAVELHDRVGQDLALAQIKLARFRQELDRSVDGRALDEGIALVEEAIESTRSLTFDLCPPILYDLGLEAALSWLADQMHDRHGFTLHVETDVPEASIRGDRACLLFRILRELVMNAVKHAQTDHAWLRMCQQGQILQIEVVDTGVGFNSSQVLGQEVGHERFGLFSVHEQIEQLGGRMKIDAEVGRGTRVWIELPASDEPASKEGEPNDVDSSLAG